MPIRLPGSMATLLEDLRHQTPATGQEGPSPRQEDQTVIDTTPLDPSPPQPPHNPGLKALGSDPVEDLMVGVAVAKDAVREAHSALHGIKGKLRAVERHFRARQKEFDSTRKVIESLKEAAGF